MNDQMKKAQQRSRASLVILLGIFLVPIILAYIVHKNPSLQPGTTKNHGTLFKPAVTLEQFNMRTVDGSAFSIEQLRGKWSLIYIGNDKCDSACIDVLIKARNGIIAQGAEGTRIRYYYISDSTFPVFDEKFTKEHPGMVLLNSASAAVLSKFKTANEQAVGQDNRLYLVDPAGNILMHYPAGFKDLGLMEDLKHLLKWSQIG